MFSKKVSDGRRVMEWLGISPCFFEAFWTDHLRFKLTFKFFISPFVYLSLGLLNLKPRFYKGYWPVYNTWFNSWNTILTLLAWVHDYMLPTIRTVEQVITVLQNCTASVCKSNQAWWQTRWKEFPWSLFRIKLWTFALLSTKVWRYLSGFTALCQVASAYTESRDKNHIQC